MVEAALALGLLVGGLALAALPPHVGMWGTALVTVVALGLGMVASTIYHLRLRAVLGPRGLLPPRWWVHPLPLHGLLEQDLTIDGIGPLAGLAGVAASFGLLRGLTIAWPWLNTFAGPDSPRPEARTLRSAAAVSLTVTLMGGVAVVGAAGLFAGKTGTVQSCGQGGNGQLGLLHRDFACGDNSDRSTPARVDLPGSGSLTQLAGIGSEMHGKAGQRNTCCSMVAEEEGRHGL